MTGMTGVNWPTIQQAAEDVAGVGLASAAAGLLCVRLLARRSMATLLFVVAAVVIASSAVGRGDRRAPDAGFRRPTATSCWSSS